jgi:hypothetical protein
VEARQVQAGARLTESKGGSYVCQGQTVSELIGILTDAKLMNDVELTDQHEQHVWPPHKVGH